MAIGVLEHKTQRPNQHYNVDRNVGRNNAGVKNRIFQRYQADSLSAILLRASQDGPLSWNRSSMPFEASAKKGPHIVTSV